MNPINVSSWRIGARLAVSLVIALLAFSAPLASAQQSPPPPGVTVMEVKAEKVMLSATFPGRVGAAAVAEVRPQVDGIIMERSFDEGSAVKQGDILFKIDSASYEATVAEAQASVAQAQAAYKAAQSEADRIQQLQQQNVSTQSEMDEAAASRDVDAAAVAVAEAELRSAEIQLERTNIVAPISGDIGLAQTTRGALVTSGQTDALATIRNIDTVHVDVTASASKVLEFRRNHKNETWASTKRKVTLELANGEPYEHTGLLTAAEPQVNVQTGVVVLRMQFPNPDKLLLPGTYVRVDMETDSADGVFVLPQQAVGRDRQGQPTALVVKDDDTVELRHLKILQAQGSNWLVNAGLEDGERIILEGSQKAAPGSKVTATLKSDKADADATVEKPEATE